MTARHHHYLSQCYLKGFTKGKAKKSKLTVIDLKEKKRFETIPRNVGGVRDFNRVDLDGVDQNAIETGLSIFEAKAATALKLLHEKRDFTGEVKQVILNLIALFAVRSPERREHYRKFHAQIEDYATGLTLASKERWEWQVEKLKTQGPSYKDSCSYQEMVDFYNSKKYTTEVPREHHISMEMSQIDVLLPLLFDRTWKLIESNEETGPFITTDNPVRIMWIDPEHVPLFYRDNPAFGLQNTRICFSVSQDLALVGEFDDEEKKVSPDEDVVATFNTNMMTNCYKQIYTSKVGFKICSKDGSIFNGNQLLKKLNI